MVPTMVVNFDLAQLLLRQPREYRNVRVPEWESGKLSIRAWRSEHNDKIQPVFGTPKLGWLIHESIRLRRIPLLPS